MCSFTYRLRVCLCVIYLSRKDGRAANTVRSASSRSEVPRPTERSRRINLSRCSCTALVWPVNRAARRTKLWYAIDSSRNSSRRIARSFLHARITHVACAKASCQGQEEVSSLVLRGNATLARTTQCYCRSSSSAAASLFLYRDQL